ncbi:unnamed protein product [Adineta ricciae]|uniref:F-box domain-containing protein n=1 Tax=Adineta ricciae TaxID=249248 RepID=A0A815VUF5_ADIRI|nr:unnamed protein product [Adineta ricciae]
MERNTMYNNFSTNQLQLETFPDELFLEIFQYIEPIDLYNFKGLNKRIDCLVQCVKLNIFINLFNDCKLDYISSFSPTQIIHLQIFRSWPSMNLHRMTEIRSLTFDCIYLPKEQIDQIIETNLSCLERLTIHNVAHDLQTPLLDILFHGEHFPSLTICYLELKSYYNLTLNDAQSSSATNNKLRCFFVDRWKWNDLGSLFNQLPNLCRFETTFEKNYANVIRSIKPHLTIKHLRVTLDDPLHDLERLIQRTPNLNRLRVRGNLRRNPVIEYFEKLAEFLPSVVPLLQRFDCEIYCCSLDSEGNEFIIQQFHTFFKNIRYFSRQDQNQCYTTDMKTYLFDNKYEGKYFIMINNNLYVYYRK